MKNKVYFIIQELDTLYVHITGLNSMADFSLHRGELDIHGYVENIKPQDYTAIRQAIATGKSIEQAVSRWCKCYDTDQAIELLRENGIEFKNKKINLL